MNVNEVKVLVLALQLCLFYGFNLELSLPTYKYIRPQYREVSNQDSFHQ